jgi:DNA-binding MarR family transcriptional regulator
MEKLTKEQVKVLDSLESTGTLDRLSEVLKVEEKAISDILERLEGLKLAKRIKSGKDDEIDFWFTTEEGDSYIRSNYLRNEFWELIDNEEVRSVTDRIVRLPDNLIDELYFRCGFIYPDHTMKALSQKEIDEIRENSRVVEGLLLETPMEEVVKNLDDIERNSYRY